MTPLRQRTCAVLFGISVTLCALVAPAAHASGAPAAAAKSPAWLAPKSAAKPPQVAGAPRMSLGRSLIALLSMSVLGGTAPATLRRLVPVRLIPRSSDVNTLH